MNERYTMRKLQTYRDATWRFSQGPLFVLKELTKFWILNFMINSAENSTSTIKSNVNFRHKNLSWKSFTSSLLFAVPMSAKEGKKNIGGASYLTSFLRNK